MTTQASLSATAIDVVGQYNQAAKSLVATYFAGTERVVGGLGQRYAKLVNRANLPLVSDSVKERLVGAEQRVCGFVMSTVTRACDGAQNAIDRVSNGVSNGITLIDEKTTWANDMAIVTALRPMNLRAANLSLQLAGRVAQGASRLSERVAGNEAAAVEEAPARQRAAKPVAKAKAPATKTAAAKRSTRKAVAVIEG